MRVPGIAYVKGRNYSKDAGGKPVVTTKYGIAIHNTANDATAEGEADYATRRTDDVSSHFYVDGDSVVQSLDTGWRAWHAASTIGNSNSISVEITGVNAWSRTTWLANVDWDRLGRVLASVIRHHWPDGTFALRRASVTEMTSNPRVKAFYGHHDMTRAWGGDHTDPGPNFPWDRLIDAVRTALTPETAMTSVDLKYDPRQRPTAVGNRAAATLLADLWGQEIAEASPVDGEQSARTKRLVRIEAKLDQLLAGPAGAVDVAALAEALKPHLEAAAETAVRRVLGSVDGATPVA